MEIEASGAQVVGKKLWNIVRIVMFMVRKGVSKSKIMVELHLMMKKGKLAAGKAIANSFFNHHHHSSFSCRSNDALNFVSPREYEFSCSNTPIHPFHRRKHHHHHHHHLYRYDDVAAVQKALEMCFNPAEISVDASSAASPFISLPGFGKSPLVRQLRITDSPFPLKDDVADNGQVDKQAEEFINRFYKDLKSQKKLSSLESSANHYIWSR